MKLIKRKATRLGNFNSSFHVYLIFTFNLLLSLIVYVLKRETEFLELLFNYYLLYQSINLTRKLNEDQRLREILKINNNIIQYIHDIHT